MPYVCKLCYRTGRRATERQVRDRTDKTHCCFCGSAHPIVWTLEKARRAAPTCTQIVAALLGDLHELPLREAIEAAAAHDLSPSRLTAEIRRHGTLGCGCTEERACDGGVPRAWNRFNRAWTRVVAERRRDSARGRE